MSLKELQASKAGTQYLNYTVKVNECEPFSSSISVDCDAQIKDVRDVILVTPEVVTRFGNITHYNWTVYFVDGDNREALDNTLVLNKCEGYDELIADAQLELVNNGSPEPGIVVENAWPLPVVIQDPDGEIDVPKFTMGINVTVPASTTIENIMLHSNVPDVVSSRYVKWSLILVHEDSNEEDVLSDDDTLRSIADNNILAGPVHLKVKVIS